MSVERFGATDKKKGGEMSEWNKLIELIELHNNQDEKGVIKFIEKNMDNLTPLLSDAILESITLIPENVKTNISTLKLLQEKLSPVGVRACIRFELLKIMVKKVVEVNEK